MYLRKDIMRRGRPSKANVNTKLNSMLENRGWTRKRLVQEINSLFPEQPISSDAVSRIVTGDRTDYALSTVYRICSALEVTPNDILDFDGKIREKRKKSKNEVILEKLYESETRSATATELAELGFNFRNVLKQKGPSYLTYYFWYSYEFGNYMVKPQHNEGVQIQNSNMDFDIIQSKGEFVVAKREEKQVLIDRIMALPKEKYPSIHEDLRSGLAWYNYHRSSSPRASFETVINWTERSVYGVHRGWD
jgi:DNA-binding Xre family transcriptional regulator